MNNFKLAMKSTFVFALIIVIISTIISYPYFHSETYHYQDAYVREQMAGDIDFIICGASQAQRGISSVLLDEELGVCSYNISSPLMTLMGRYYILEKEIERNPVDTVIVELCYDTLMRDRDEVSPEGEYYVLGRLKTPWERMEYFLKSARLDEYFDFYSDTLSRGLYAWRNLGNNQIGTSDKYVSKGFEPLETHEILMPNESDYNQEEILINPAEENLKYLDEIFSLCKENNIRVIMVATPLADSAIMSYDQLDTVHDIYKDISEKWNCEYYNFSLYKGKSELLKDSEAYFDRNHLSEKGAEIFTVVLADVIEKSMAGEDAYDLFYDSYEQAQLNEIIPSMQ